MNKLSLKIIPFALLAITAANPAHGAGLTGISEGFNDINTLAADGWAFQNNSNPAPLVTTPTANWTQGNPNFFSSQAGPANSYIFAGPDSTAGGSGTQAGIGQVNNWLITPELDFSNGGTFSFYTRTVQGNFSYATYLEVRQSNNGSSTFVGSTPTSVGDFTTLDTNVGSLDGSIDYPGLFADTYGQFTFTVAPTGGSGRIAFRYFAPSGGVNGQEGGLIGIDTVSYTAVPEPSSILGILSLGSIGLLASKHGKVKKAKA
jgi:PEP-CTERM motif